MEKLPNEIIEKILVDPKLSIVDIVNFSSTCSRFQDIVNSNDTVWKAKFFQCWSATDVEITSNDWHYETIIRKNLEKQLKKGLSEMSSKFYHLDMKNINGLHLKFVIPLLTTHKFGYYYIRDYLIHRNSLHLTKRLTEKYYSTILLKFINKKHFLQIWDDLKVKKEEQTPEKGAILVSMWKQEDKPGIEKLVVSELDAIADLVRQRLIERLQDHPLKNVPENTLSVWKRENIPDNMFDPEHCKSILLEMKFVFFHVLKYQLCCNINLHKSTKCGIDDALIDRETSYFMFAIIFESVARRLGVKIEILYFWDNCMLKWNESYKEAPSEGHYIDLIGTELFKNLARPVFDNINVIMKPCNIEQIAQKTTIYVYSYAGLDYNPFITEIMELSLVFNPYNLEFYHHLCRSFMEEEMDARELILKLISVRDEMRKEDWRWFQPLFHSLVVYQESWERNHDRNPKLVVQSRSRKVKLAVGMIVRDKVNFRNGIIFGWNRVAKGNQKHFLGLKKEQIFYKLLMDGGRSDCVPQENLQILHTPPTISHPSIGRYFDEYCMSYYKPNPQLQAEYPDDVEALLRILKNDRDSKG